MVWGPLRFQYWPNGEPSVIQVGSKKEQPRWFQDGSMVDPSAIQDGSDAQIQLLKMGYSQQGGSGSLSPASTSAVGAGKGQMNGHGTDALASSADRLRPGRLGLWRGSGPPFVCLYETIKYLEREEMKCAGINTLASCADRPRPVR